VTDAVVGAVEATVRRLNPRAQVLRTEQGSVDLAEVLGTGRLVDVAGSAPGTRLSSSE
jgi:G3E family GTPase